MKQCHGWTFAIASAVLAAACGDASTESDVEACTAETSAVTATVASGQATVFDWEPGCAVAMVLVEADGGDTWLVSTDDTTWDSPDQANGISPPVTYGVVPNGVSEGQAPEPLVSGATYELILWRILPEGSTAQCQQRFANTCLLTVHSFTR